MKPIRVADVLTHRRPGETTQALGELARMARAAGVTLTFNEEEAAKHRSLVGEGIIVRAGTSEDAAADTDLCIALGGDGTILNALRLHAGTGVPVFGINFGEMGFLATVDRDAMNDGFARALTGDFEVLSLPAIEVTGARGRWLAVND